MFHNLEHEREIVNMIYGIFPTIEEAFVYVDQQLKNMEFERGIAIFQDIVYAVRSVFTKLYLFSVSDNQELLMRTRKMRLSISEVVNLYESGKMVEVKTLIDERLRPAYIEWKEAVLIFLSSERFRYLQN